MTLERTDVDGPVGKLAAYRGGNTAPDVLPVVLVHGINMSASVWDGVVEGLAGDREVVTVDLRGHGDSVMSGPFTAAVYVDDVVVVMDVLGIERAHLVGTSFGGPIACNVVARAPERVASVAALGSAVSAEGAVDIDAGIAAMREMGAPDFFRGFMGQASFAPGTDPEIIERAVVAATDDRRSIDLIAEVVRTVFSADESEAVAGVRAPALVMTGEHDMTCPIPAGEILARALGVELTRSDRGHMAAVEDPASVVGPLRAHLAAND